MDTAISQLVERLLQPIALGILILFPSLFLLSTVWQEPFPVSNQNNTLSSIVSDVNLATVFLAMVSFVLGQFASILGQVIFNIVFKMLVLEKGELSFFAKVKNAKDDDAFIKGRYDHVRYQVDLLCGVIGVGLIVAALAAYLLRAFDAWYALEAAVGALVCAIISLLAAFFHAKQFRDQLEEALPLPDGRRSEKSEEQKNQEPS